MDALLTLICFMIIICIIQNVIIFIFLIIIFFTIKGVIRFKVQSNTNVENQENGLGFGR